VLIDYQWQISNKQHFVRTNKTYTYSQMRPLSVSHFNIQAKKGKPSNSAA